MAGGVAAVAAVVVIGGALVFGGSGDKPSAAPVSAEAKQNLERKLDLYAVERALVQYSASHAGAHPTLYDMNNGKFRATSLAGIGLAQATDPLGNTDQFAPQATAGAYAYIATPAGCDNKKVKCTGHKVVATLSDGQQISVPQ